MKRWRKPTSHWMTTTPSSTKAAQPKRSKVRYQGALLALVMVLASGCSDAQNESSPSSVAAGGTTSQSSQTTVDETALDETVDSTPATKDEEGAVVELNIQGHRGARGLRPENTLPSFEVALDLEVTTLELDLHLSRDDQVVIWHDPELTGDKCSLVDSAPPDLELPVAIRSLTADQLVHFRCDRNPDPSRFASQTSEPTSLAGSHYQPVTLSELFQFVLDYTSAPNKSSEQKDAAASVEFNIETKRVPAHPEYIGDDFDGESVGAFEQALLDAIDAAELGPRVVIQSFDFRSLRAVHQVRPDLRLAALTSQQVPDFPELASDGTSIWSPNQRLVSADTVQDAHANGLLVIPWTVNDVEDMKRLRDLGVDGLISDRPDISVGLR